MSKLESHAAPKCFDACITDVTTDAGLSSDEKNCIRECYIKRVSSRDDFGMLLTFKAARENVKARRE